MPSEALTTHLDLLTGLDEHGTATGVRCRASSGRTYRLQIGYADQYDDSASDSALVCPDDPRKPDSVDADGASASLKTGYWLGELSPMIMPLAAVRGIVCTWPFRREDDEPVVRDLSAAEAERVRIGLHAIAGGVVDCGVSRDPTYTAVVEDRTGTRRAVTILGSECSTVVRSDKGYGLGFAWLDR